MGDFSVWVFSVCFLGCLFLWGFWCAAKIAGKHKHFVLLLHLLLFQTSCLGLYCVCVLFIVKMFSRTAVRRLAPFVAAAQRSAPMAVRSFGSGGSNAAGGPGVKAIWAGFTGLFIFSAISISRSDGINFEAVKKDISDAIDADESKRNDGTSMGPTLVRLAWHAAGTYSATDKTGMVLFSAGSRVIWLILCVSLAQAVPTALT
jgi:hypothetical protein